MQIRMRSYSQCRTAEWIPLSLIYSGTMICIQTFFKLFRTCSCYHIFNSIAIDLSAKKNVFCIFFTKTFFFVLTAVLQFSFH